MTCYELDMRRSQKNNNWEEKQTDWWLQNKYNEKNEKNSENSEQWMKLL